MLLPICQITLLKLGGYCVGDHLFPFRTESLSPIAPMVLVNPGRVGRRQTFIKAPPIWWGFFYFRNFDHATTPLSISVYRALG